ncbi:MAG TPA: VOC family protein [Blastocatellia bacterium]|nr:VOC family protein [Blastocatellia bacterium]
MIKMMKFTGIFVSDVDRAYDFYVNKLGFEVKTDQPMGDSRWLELVPPGAETRIAVCKPFSGQSDARIGGFTAISFNTDDIQATYEELSAKGVHFTEKPARQPWGDIQAQFADPDGNVFLLTEGDD